MSFINWLFADAHGPHVIGIFLAGWLVRAAAPLYVRLLKSIIIAKPVIAAKSPQAGLPYRDPAAKCKECGRFLIEADPEHDVKATL